MIPLGTVASARYAFPLVLTDVLTHENPAPNGDDTTPTTVTVNVGQPFPGRHVIVAIGIRYLQVERHVHTVSIGGVSLSRDAYIPISYAKGAVFTAPLAASSTTATLEIVSYSRDGGERTLDICVYTAPPFELVSAQGVRGGALTLPTAPGGFYVAVAASGRFGNDPVISATNFEVEDYSTRHRIGHGATYGEPIPLTATGVGNGSFVAASYRLI